LFFEFLIFIILFYIYRNRFFHKNYEFPRSGKNNLKFQITWTYAFPWIRYSKLHDSAFYLTYILFPPSDGISKGIHQFTEKLVVEKFDNWKKAKDHKNMTGPHQSSFCDFP
jgi:hypothetical protein